MRPILTGGSSGAIPVAPSATVAERGPRTRPASARLRARHHYDAGDMTATETPAKPVRERWTAQWKHLYDEVVTPGCAPVAPDA